MQQYNLYCYVKIPFLNNFLQQEINTSKFSLSIKSIKKSNFNKHKAFFIFAIDFICLTFNHHYYEYF